MTSNEKHSELFKKFKQSIRNKRIITEKEIEEMEINDWQCFSKEFLDSDTDFMGMLERSGFENIEFYLTETTIRGYYEVIAMVK